mmetsp:Transcript_16176/g.37145  ORF Transcript_16176/g.37145 Transcript_16176/m.37145 type:complete len:369 (+) Transcript_16176:59-1165(+)
MIPSSTCNNDDDQTNSQNHFALFDIDEVSVGEKLGSGGFCNVHKVRGFHLHGRRNSKIKCPNQQERDQLTKSCQNVAIKFLKKEFLKDLDRFDEAAQDLEFEADVLSQLTHPHILKILGWAAGGFDAYFDLNRHDAYFILMERLQKNLAMRIEEWKEMSVAAGPSTLTETNLSLEKLQIARDIASALEYLHDKGYIFRDLKPENIGLDSQSRGKLFDFGLSRRMPEGDMDDEFEMSGMTGTTRYMAPEVFERKPYNTKADVYSFAHVLWEMLALEKPYEGYTNAEHKQETVLKEHRPNLDPSWPLGIQKLLSRSWHRDMAERPTMKEVCTILEMEIAVLQAERLSLVTCAPKEATRLSKQQSLASGAA